MAVKIRLKRFGKMRAPYYRIVVMDARSKRDGRAIEEIGKYHPTEEPSYIEVDTDRAQYWLGVGAQPSEQVAAILKITGDWQKFKGLPGQEGTLRVAEPKADKLAIFEAAAKDAANEPAKEATTPKKKAAAKAEEPVEVVEVVEVAEAADGTVVVDDVVAAVEADGTVEVVEAVEVVDADGTVEAVEVVAEEIPAETTEA